MNNIYIEKQSFKIIKTQHEICLYMRRSAKDFKQAFNKIPDDAILIDEYLDTNNNTVLVFEVEEEVKD